MCLAIPAKVLELANSDSALVDVGGVRKRVNLSLLPGLAPGDYIIVHVGYALSRVDEAEAARTLALFVEMNALAAEDDP